jgi:hypothetical protein
MGAHQRDVIETVERRHHAGILGVPIFRRLLLIRLAGKIVAQRLREFGSRLVIALARRRSFDDRRP